MQVGYKAKQFGTAADECFLSDISDKKKLNKLASEFASSKEIEQVSDYDLQIQQCQKDGYISLHSPETRSVLELSAPVRHLQSKRTLTAITIPYFTAELIDYPKKEIIDLLLNNIEQLQEKITIIMPNFAS